RLSARPGRGGGRPGAGGTPGLAAAARLVAGIGFGRGPGVPAGVGPGAGCPRFGSIFGSSVLLPPGPLSATSRGVILSIRQPLTASPSVSSSDLALLTAYIES